MTEDYYVKKGILYCDLIHDGGKSIEHHKIGPCKELIHRPFCCRKWMNVAFHEEYTCKIIRLKYCNDCGKPLESE